MPKQPKAQVATIPAHNPALTFGGIELPCRERHLRKTYSPELADRLWDLIETGQATSDAAIAYALETTEETLLEWVELRPAMRAAYVAAVQAAKVRVIRAIENNTLHPAAGKYLLGTLGVMTILEKKQIEIQEKTLALKTGLTDARGNAITISFDEAPVPLSRTVDPDTGLVVEAVQ